VPDPLAPLRSRPERAAVLCDFDGTISPIVDDPAEARPLPGSIDTLAALADRYAVVAVVSGRPVSFLIERVGTGGGRVLLSGLYGLEAARRTASGRWEVERRPETAAWAPVVEAVAADAASRAPAGVIVEPKGLSLTVHWRTAPSCEDWARTYAREASARTGLVAHPAKASVELRLPVDRDKGTVVEELAGGLDAAAFVGDDVGDLPAVGALRRLPLAGVAVVVRTDETPATLLDVADVVVDGPAGALDLLRGLLGERASRLG
jgi:trehalose 6-phosphate phosphatase